MREPAEVSVLLPVRDGAAHVDEAIASVLEQTWSDLELIVVDDGSTDSTLGQVRHWAERDPRVRVIVQEPLGIVAALERAREAARGRYLARMDADDVSHRERLAAQRSLMEDSPRVALCGCGVEYFPDSVVRDGARRYARWLNAMSEPEDLVGGLFVECPLAHPSFFMRADAVASVGGYVDRGWAEDYDLVLRLWEAGFDLASVPDVLLGWRESVTRLSRSHPRYAPEAFRACKVHYLRRTLLADGRDVVVWGAGPVGKAMSRALQAEGVVVRAFVELDPRKIGQEIHGAPVLNTSSGLELHGPVHLAAVGQAGARRRIEGMLREAGFVASEEFVAVA